MQREGNEPRRENARVGADVLRDAEGHIRGPTAMAPASPPGSVTRHVTKAGSGTREVLWGPPKQEVGWHNRHTGRKPIAPEGSRMSPSSKDVGNAHGAERDPYGDRSMATSTTPRGGRETTTGVERIARRARQAPQTR